MADYIILRNSVQQASWVAFKAWQATHSRQSATAWCATINGCTGYDFGRRFKVILGGWNPVESKMGTYEKTISGKLDVSVGPIFKAEEFVILCKDSLYSEDDVEQNYTRLGTKGDLKTYFELNNPFASPSNKITVVDFFTSNAAAVGVDAVLTGDHVPVPLSVTVDGPEASYTIKIQVQYLVAVA